MNIDLVLEVVLSLIAVFMAIVLHEVSHGYVAARLGDPTAKANGRLTLNPLAHIDPIGTILVPLVLAIIGAPLFGWAKPVPVNPNYFRNPFRGMLYVAIAGPTTNILLALLTAGIGRLLLLAVPDSLVLSTATGFATNLTRAAFYLLGAFVIYNVILAVFNLIPIPPLDGSRVLTYFLPPRGKRFMLSMERYGFLVLMAVILLGGVTILFRGVNPILESLLGVKWVWLLKALG
jgi:Zn-dependent protease